MADGTVGRPLREAHLADELWTHPVVLASPRQIPPRERACVGLERAKSPVEISEPGGIEARAGATDVGESVRLVHPQVDGAQVNARALRVGVAADHELLTPLALDLAPVGSSATPVGTVAPLRDHSLEPSLAGRAEEALAVPSEVVGVAERIDRRDELAEERLPIPEREPAEVASPEREAIIQVGDDRDATRVARGVHPTLEELEARASLLVERHDLPVEREIATRQPSDRGRHLGIAAGHVEAV